MYASDDTLKTAREIATPGVEAGAGFDKNPAAPVCLDTLKRKR